MTSRRWVVPALAVVLALITTAAVVGYLSTLQRRTAVAPPVPMATVVVATHPIPTRHIVAAGDLKEVQAPASGIHPHALHAVGEGVNRVAVTQIFEGEQVISDMLAPADVGASLSYVVPKGMRAVTLAMNEVADVAGFVAPGDRVDIVGTVTAGGPEQSRIFLQNVLVLAAAQQADQKPGQPAKVTTSVTVALTPEQVEALTEIDNSGRIRLALRPAGVSGTVQTRGQTTLSALSGLGVPAPAAAVPAPRAIPVIVRVTAPAPSQTVEIWRGGQRQTVQF
ncbi:MAG TPA: Flp pilus assembly protein CpaB [Tepidiformaceae bacterium]|nr:Flp pilus assembly protein CpaB [Tepidiformaceae bacterium]